MTIRAGHLLKAAGGLVLTIILLAGIGVAASWAPDRSVDSLKARWAQPPSQFIPVAGMQVHLRDEGPKDDPDPVILLHGSPDCLHTWDGWAETLRQTKRVVRFDLPGFGLTGPTPDGGYSIRTYISSVIGVMDTLGISRATLVGHSFGGQVAWETVLANPSRFTKLILVDSSGFPTTTAAASPALVLSRIPVVNRLMEHILPRVFVSSGVKKIFGDPAKVSDDLVDRFYEMTLREGNRAALAGRLQQTPPVSADVAHVSELKLPTLIIWGGRDRLIDPANAERFHTGIANSRLVLFDDLGHSAQEEDPARTVAAAMAFIRG